MHLAQAKCYAAIYLIQNDLEQIGIKMTYCNIDTEEVRAFTSVHTKDTLYQWFWSLLEEYQKWADFEFEWSEKKNAVDSDTSFSV